MSQQILGVIGGSGLYALDALKIEQEKIVSTPYGECSSPIVMGSLHSKKVAFLSRHGAGHKLLPHEINYRANIWALKSLGVTQVMSVSAVGSLVKEIAPGELSLVSQYIDFTKQRENSFFGNGLAAHISTAETSCHVLAEQISKAAKTLNLKIHENKTYVCVQGPRLGTRAESFMFKSFGAHLVGMTNIPESFLAKEAQMAYCTLAVATDYDCWMEDPNMHVSVHEVVSKFFETLGKAKSVLEQVCKQEWDIEKSPNRKALEFAILTAPELRTEKDNELLKILQA